MSALCDLTDLKAYVGVTGTSDDALLSRLVSASSGFFEAECGRTFATASYTEVRNGDGRQVMVLRHQPVVSVQSVTVDGNTVAQATVSSDPGWVAVDGAVWMRPVSLPYAPYVTWAAQPTGRFNEGRGNVTVTYTAGFDPIPADVQQAVIELAALKYRERKHVGTSATSLAGTSVTFLPSLIPASVQSVIEAYRRPPAF